MQIKASLIYTTFVCEFVSLLIRQNSFLFKDPVIRLLHDFVILALCCTAIIKAKLEFKCFSYTVLPRVKTDEHPPCSFQIRL